jgi:hypothetical protein
LSNHSISVNLNYRWVMIAKLIDLDAPGFWKLANISKTLQDGHSIKSGLRLVRELEGQYIMIECFPNPEHNNWKFRGWVLVTSSKVSDYKEIELACEVVSISEEPVLSSLYDMTITDAGDFEFTLDSFSKNDSPNKEYAFSSLLESHSRATYLKYLLKDVSAVDPNFTVERIHQEVREIEAFGRMTGGDWSISSQEDIINNAYNIVFTIWRKGKPSNDIRNNPNIISRENKYYVSESRTYEPIVHLANILAESIKLYSPVRR